LSNIVKFDSDFVVPCDSDLVAIDTSFKDLTIVAHDSNAYVSDANFLVFLFFLN